MHAWVRYCTPKLYKTLERNPVRRRQVETIALVRVSADGKSYTYTVFPMLSDLYVVGKLQ
jgi:hypothetical protein